jgi:hypothetical protein
LYKDFRGFFEGFLWRKNAALLMQSKGGNLKITEKHRKDVVQIL